MCASFDPSRVDPRRVSRAAPGSVENITFWIKDLRRYLQSRMLMSALGQKQTHAPQQRGRSNALACEGIDRPSPVMGKFRT
jgi:hypothetical protein